ncbi:HlyD family secretion protein [Hymenobacter metallicola]|uniref:HlyD family efflux transporter periplasmic adaptor subunit n=1 Tax=Hymenobacter metallicola TaxID=2563114 RepID=A0A4Z0QFW2_9BACT|nr:HlyD family efflux transporter periplasmic adaptor subunit [Hymenobacter metallicola]TGE28113.1 HlyD family efflux transporter periplasmic adaptor subunit [Hymenobacter metallicola]
MNNKHIPELDDMKNNQFGYLQKLSRPSNAFYNFILITVILIIIALPFISIEVTTSSPASIQTNKHQQTIYSPLSGKIATLKIENNRPVKKGDTLLVLDDAHIINEIELLKDRKAVIEQNMHDITILQNNLKDVRPLMLYTTQYQSQYAHYIEQKSLLSAKFDNAERAYLRYSDLFKQKVIPSSEYEKYELDHKQAQIDLKILETTTRSQWQTDKYSLRQELDNLAVREAQQRELLTKSVVVANMSGTGYNAEGIQSGTFVQGGQKIAEIIPDNDLIAICLISPKDIGFIKENQKVRLQIDAYNYYDWGTINGSVLEIVKDVSIVDNQPFYVVHCKADKTFLTLKSGYRGNLLKGMTGRANFVLTNRTLWQLLFTNINEWLDPKQD